MAAQSNIKPLRPRSNDIKYYGTEPQVSEYKSEDPQKVWLGRSLNWYNYFYTKKEAKEMIVQHLEYVERIDDAKKIKKLKDKHIDTTCGWLARMKTIGFKFEDDLEERFQKWISKFLDIVDDEIVDNPEKAEIKKPNIQDHLREKANEACAEVDELFDQFVASDEKFSDKWKIIGILRTMNISPQMISYIKTPYEKELEEYIEVQAGTCDQLNEGYAHWGKIKVRNVIKFCEAVIADCDSYVQLKKVERKPRARKPKTPEQLARKFKYLKEFKELSLTSEKPTKLVNATEAWLYNTKTRKLIHVVADEYAKSFTIKGTSLVGFDAKKSVQKTLRKPADQLKQIMKVGKPAMRKQFEEIKATEIKFNGRGNDNIMILKAW